MKYYLNVVADTNDSDYIESFSEISKDNLEKIKPLIKEIKNFEPYEAEGAGYIGLNQHHHNWPVGEIRRDDLGEKSIEQIYSNIEPSIIRLFNEHYVPYGEYGVHTIESIFLYKCIEEPKKLL